MSRQAPVLSRFAVRAAALTSACAITTLILVLHAADLSRLGGHDVVVTKAPNGATVAVATPAARAQSMR